MDLVTGAGVAVTVIVPVPRERMWELVTAIERVGEWSPEVTGARWRDTAGTLVVGGRFTGVNRFPNGSEGRTDCVVTEVCAGTVFAWDVLDDVGLAGSSWRYELADGDEGTTVVWQSFRHGPGVTGARIAEGFDGRIVTLCTNMIATITAMAASTS